MKQKLSESQFQTAVADLDISRQTLEIAHGVLVEGVPQLTYVAKYKITKGAVSQAIKRVWTAHTKKNLPAGYERVSVVLPKHQAFIVKQWANKSKKDDS